MTKKEYLELLKDHTPEAYKALASEVEDLKKSPFYTFLEALVEHMLKNQLRVKSSDVADFGRAQGINAVLEYFDYIQQAAKAELQEKEQPVPEGTNFPSGYGVMQV